MKLFFLLIFLSLLIFINLWVVKRIHSIEHMGGKKGLMIIGVWMIPFIGAYLVNMHIRHRVPQSQETAMQTFDSIPEQDDAPEEICLNEKCFSIIENAGLVDGIPIIDWKALGTWAQSFQNQTEVHDARELGRRAWLLHLRDVMGAYLAETEFCYILSTLEPKVAETMANYVWITRKRIAALLPGLAKFPSNEKSIVIVFDNQDDYYHYVSVYHREGQEYGASSGMFINHGCAHFVSVRDDLTEIEPVIAHELSHLALSYLQLPVWLDEGIAVNTEQQLTGARALIYTPQELHEKHLNHWNAESIQDYWSGRAFQKSEGQLLSYELARISVSQLARNWKGFKKFVLAANRQDAGSAAAESVYSVSLGSFICALLQFDNESDWAPRPSDWH